MAGVPLTINAVFRKAVDDGWIRGCFWVEELALLDFLPLAVRPHAHALVDAQDMDGDTFLRLFGQLPDSMRSEVELQPNLDVLSIADDSTLCRKLRYCIKPIHLERAYLRTWNCPLNQQRELATDLNRDLLAFVEGLHLVTQHRIQVHTKGTLHPKHGRYLGVQHSRFRLVRAAVHRISSRSHDAEGRDALTERPPQPTQTGTP